MARKVRIFIENTPQLVVIRGNNKEKVFVDEEDYQKFLNILKEQSLKTGCLLHAYVLMPNHIHLLLTPTHEDSLSKMMQGVGRMYVRFFNQKYGRSGTLWEGRYKSAIVDVANYLFTCMKYIEQNPIRAGLVTDFKDYPWSSYKANTSGITDGLIEFHELYKNLNNSLESCGIIYEKALNENVNKEILEEIRLHVNKQTILGSSVFMEKVEELTGQAMVARDRGRPGQQIIKITPWNKKESLMFKKVEVLDKEKYSSLKLIQKTDLSFAKSLTAVPVVASEILMVSKGYPVVFTDQEQPTLMALVAIANSSNLAIDQNGKWIGDYAPAHLQNYPFGTLKVSDENENRIIVIDPESPLLSETEGDALFTEDKEPTEVLQNYVKALENYDIQMKITMTASKAFADAGILDDREISVGEGEDKKALVKGFKVVNKEKLNALDDATLADWVRKGYISLIDLHLRSLENINTLVSRSGL